MGSGSVNMLDNQGRQCGMALPCATIPKTGLAAGHVPSQFWHPLVLALLGGGCKRRNENSIMPSLLPIAGESQVEKSGDQQGKRKSTTFPGFCFVLNRVRGILFWARSLGVSGAQNRRRSLLNQAEERSESVMAVPVPRGQPACKEWRRDGSHAEPDAAKETECYPGL